MPCAFRKTKGQTHFVLLVVIFLIVVVDFFVVKLFSTCAIPFLNEITCPGVSVRYYAERYHETPYKAELLAYTFLKTKTKLSVITCVQYLDCIRDTEESICKDVYGSDYENLTCQRFINETLEKLWDAQVKLSFSGYEFLKNEGKIEHSIPVSIEKEISIPFPQRKIKLKFEVW